MINIVPWHRTDDVVMLCLVEQACWKRFRSLIRCYSGFLVILELSAASSLAETMVSLILAVASPAETGGRLRNLDSHRVT